MTQKLDAWGKQFGLYSAYPPGNIVVFRSSDSDPVLEFGRIVKIETALRSGRSFHIMTLKNLSTTAEVNVSEEEVILMIITTEGADNILKLLATIGSAINAENWNQLNRRHIEKFKLTSAFEITEVLCQLISRKEKGDSLVFNERRMLESARHFLIQE